jgi:hypothetical protein
MRRPTLLLVIAVLFLLHSAPVQAAGQLDFVGKFFAGGTEFDIATYTEDAQRVALIGIVAGPQKIPVAFNSGEWDSFVDLWHKAAQVESASWQFVGSFKETTTRDKTLLIVTAGPGVQFTIIDPKGTSSFVLGKSDFGTFETKVQQVTAYLAR